MIVEGQDEVRLRTAIFENNSRPTYIREAGKYKFTAKLTAILEDLQRFGPVSRLGIIRDADESATQAFTSVCSSVAHVGLNPPKQHAGFSDGAVAVGVFIAPDGNATGAIEALCMKSIANESETNCVLDYIRCLRTNNVLYSRNPDKTFVHAYLAAQVDPMIRVGEAAQKGVWNFDHPAFESLLEFLDQLSRPV